MVQQVLLGPQRLEPNLVHAFDRFGIEGPVVAITAGWQEREGEDDELREHLGREVIELELHQRLEQIFAEDPEVFRLHRARQDQLRALQRLYRYRLDFVLEPARGLMRWKEETDLLEGEQRAAIEAVRRLDADHLDRVAAIHGELESQHPLWERPAFRRHRHEIEDAFARAGAVAIAGGHVAALVNRMRLFRLQELLGELPVFAWSAGAMALSERIVLFHDSPPQGAGNAEVLDLGLGLVPGVVALPHASKRLRLDDQVRVSLFARRFAPALCIPLDPGVTVIRRGEEWRSLAGGRRLLEDGGLEDLEALP